MPGSAQHADGLRTDNVAFLLVLSVVLGDRSAFLDLPRQPTTEAAVAEVVAPDVGVVMWVAHAVLRPRRMPAAGSELKLASAPASVVSHQRLSKRLRIIAWSVTWIIIAWISKRLRIIA